MVKNNFLARTELHVPMDEPEPIGTQVHHAALNFHSLWVSEKQYDQAFGRKPLLPPSLEHLFS
jgi:hypothetical protein